MSGSASAPWAVSSVLFLVASLRDTRCAVLSWLSWFERHSPGLVCFLVVFYRPLTVFLLYVFAALPLRALLLLLHIGLRDPRRAALSWLSRFERRSPGLV